MFLEVPRSSAIQWCLDNEFELVELDPTIESNEEGEWCISYDLLLIYYAYESVHNRFVILFTVHVSNDANIDHVADEDDFKETVGVMRIIEALRCHSWPNMVMKGKS